MLIYLLHSGIVDQSGASPQDRELSRDGVTQSRAMVRKFRVYAPQVDMALISPYRSAKQTSEALALSFPSIHFEVSELLAPDADVYAVMDAVENFDVQQLLMIGHKPLLPLLLSVMVDGTADSSRSIGCSTLVCVDMDFIAPGCGEIKYTMEP